MLEILGFPIPLPQELEFLANRWWSFALSILASVVLAAILYPLLIRAVRLLTRRTLTEIDDLVLSLSRRPFLLALSTISAILSWHCLHLYKEVKYVDRLLLALLIGVTAYWVQRLFSQLLMHHAQRFAEKSETNLDDVLVPIANQLGPVLIYTFGLAFVLQALGVSVSVIVAGIGGGSFIAGLALQESLSNMFAGISLLVDTPFKYGDLIVLGDSTICEVKKIGLRVTQLYSIKNHSVVYMPNKELANQQLTNITRPSPDLIVSFTLGVSYSADLALVREILEDVLLSHPDILGNVETKIERLQRCLESSGADGQSAKIRNGIARLKAENALDEGVCSIRDQVRNLAGWVASERADGRIDASISDLVARLRGLEVSIDGGHPGAGSLRDRMRGWSLQKTSDPDLKDFTEDRERIAKLADRSLDHLLKRVGRIVAAIAIEDPDMEGLADRLLELEKWIENNLKETVPKWKNPDVNFVNFGESALEFELEFFIDDINLEHFERQDRVLTEVRREIVDRFRARGIEMPFPQRDLWFRSPLHTSRASQEKELLP